MLAHTIAGSQGTRKRGLARRGRERRRRARPRGPRTLTVCPPAVALGSVEIPFVDVRIECDALPNGTVVRRVTGREAISELFSFELELVIRGDTSFDPSPLVGERAALVFEREGDPVRTVRGVVCEVVERRAKLVDATLVSARLVPHAFQTTLFETQEIFLDLSVPEILARKLELIGLGEHLDLRLRETYPKRELVVQYKESDYHFLSRIAEHVGVSFFFDHEGERDRIVFTDVEGFPSLGRPVRLLDHGERQDGVFQFETRTRMIPSVYVMQEWNYRTPSVELTESHESPLGLTGGVVEFGAHYKTPAEGRALAKVRASERECGQQTHEGESDVCELEAGRRFELDGQELLVVEVEHEVTQAVGLSGDKDVSRYKNRFRAISAERTYRPPRKTPRPRIHGVTSGLVVDELGNEDGKYAKIDEHGRYLVRMLFDTAGSGERRASRPIRMAQPLSGEGYGVHFPLRPGTEVLIAFVDGDPDRPVVVGSVPNHVTPSPVVRGNSIESQIKTQSGILIQLTDR